MNLPYSPINIEGAVNGLVVHIGCRRFVFEDEEAALAEISAYMKDPHAKIREYGAKYPKIAGYAAEAVEPYHGNCVGAVTPAGRL